MAERTGGTGASGDARGTLTLGPVPFLWPAERWRDFYFRVADEAPVDCVVLGEVVCAKRRSFHDPHMAEVADRLGRAGKEVVFATPALIMDGRELAPVRDLVEAGDLLVEANDVSAVALLAGRPHAIGPYVNVYNEGTLAYLAGAGAVRAALPVELPRESLAVLAAASPVPLEVQVFGRLPLAISARCYHARARGRHKDNCQFACAETPDGMAVETLHGQPFLAVNGTQTLSHHCCNLIGEIADLEAIGIRRYRLSPLAVDMVEVAEIFRGVIDGALDPAAADGRLADLVDPIPFSNGYYHGVEGAALLRPGGEADPTGTAA